MALHLDGPARRSTELRALIRAVLDAGEHDETDWIEWKSSLDLTVRAGQATVARHVLGMANRDPERARRSAGGCGYVLVGVEPGRLHGMATLDPADLEPGLVRYLGEDGPVWTPLWVEVDDVHVLVVVVDPPAPGDPIHTLRRDIDRYRDGDIFVRRQGRTERASSAEVRMLQARAAPPARDRALQVEVTPPLTPVRGLVADEEAVDAFCTSQERRLLTVMQTEPDTEPPGRAGTVIDVASAGLAGGAIHNAMFGRRWKAEDRTEDEYRDQVTEYLEKLRERVVDAAVDELMSAEVAIVELRLVNPTDMPFTNIRLEVYFPGDGFLCERFASDVVLPRPPRPWGGRWVNPMAGIGAMPPSLSRVMASDFLPHAGGPSVDIDNSASARLTFSEVDLAPRDTVTLAPFHFVAGAELAGERVVGSWTARSTAADGVCSGEVVVEVDASPLPLADLVNPPG